MEVGEVEVTHELIDEMIPLLEAHRQELTAFKDIELHVATQKYVDLYKLGCLKCFIIRDEANSIVAYLAYFINQNLHYYDYTYAVQDVLYVRPDRRGAMLGYKIIKHADKVLKDKYNVSVVVQHVKIKHDFKPLLDKLGYERVEYNYMKRLK